jgi:hypothetical protein
MFQTRLPANECAEPVGRTTMKLQLIAAGVVTYTIATMAWLCYVGI